MFNSFINHIGFCDEAKAAFTDVYNTLLSDKAALEETYRIIDNFYLGTDKAYLTATKEVAKSIGVNEYTYNMVFTILAFIPLRYVFHAKGWSDEVYWDTMADIVIKNDECKKLYGVWGNFTLEWYSHFAWGRIVSLGRLQFETIPAPDDYKDLVKKGERVITVHIPSGGHLLIEDVYDSLDRAYKFYGCEGDAIFNCNSWLLYTPQGESYKAGSNLQKFYSMWDVVRNEHFNNDFWRVFYQNYEDADISSITPHTSLEKWIIERLQNGKTMGEGFSYMVYKPKK